METLPAIQDSQVDILITQAIDKGVSVETLERLLTMRRELKAEYAKECYIKSMSDFQKECPVIRKSKKVWNTKTGVFLYSYAPLDSIVYQVKDLLNKHGFSYAIRSIPNNEYAEVSCIVKHINGHEEVYTVKFPLGNKTDIMSATQYYAAAHTFVKRYAFCDAFGIMTGNGDTDGRLPVKEVNREDIEEYIKIIRRLILITQHTEEDIIEYAKVEKIEDITAPKLRRIINNLQSIIDEKDK